MTAVLSYDHKRPPEVVNSVIGLLIKTWKQIRQMQSGRQEQTVSGRKVKPTLLKLKTIGQGINQTNSGRPLGPKSARIPTIREASSIGDPRNPSDGLHSAYLHSDSDCPAPPIMPLTDGRCQSVSHNFGPCNKKSGNRLSGRWNRGAY